MTGTQYVLSSYSGVEFPHPREYEYEAIYRAYLFGSFRLFRGRQRLKEEMPRRNKSRKILIWFLLNPGKPISADQFIDLFWPDSSAEKAVGNFHVAMHCLRRLLQPDLRPGEESAFIRRKPNNFYYFQPGKNWWTDISDVEMLLERGCASDAQGDGRRACFYYRRVANYCIQGVLAEDDFGDWLLPYRRRYNQIYTQALLRLIQLHMQSDHPEELLDYAYQMVHLAQHNEVATRVIIDAHLQSGDVVRAQHRLSLFWDSVERELGVPPGREFHALRERIHALTHKRAGLGR